MTAAENPRVKMSLRDAQRALTRDRIRDAASHLFHRSGYSVVTMEEIAVAAQVSRSTLYVHYPDKVDLSTEIAKSYGDALCALVARLPGPTPSHAQIHDWLGLLEALVAREDVAAALFWDLSSRREAPAATRLIGEQLIMALAAQLPAFAQNLNNTAKVDRARAWAEAAMRELGWAFQRASGEGKKAAAARMSVAADIFECFVQAQSGME